MRRFIGKVSKLEYIGDRLIKMTIVCEINADDIINVCRYDIPHGFKNEDIVSFTLERINE